MSASWARAMELRTRAPGTRALPLLLLLLAGPAALERPQCRPDTDCVPESKDDNSSNEYFFTVNGRSLNMEYDESTRRLTVTCDQGRLGPAPAADDRALPALPAPAVLEYVEFGGCRLPARSYGDALRGLNVNATERLWLLRLPDEPTLSRGHLAGLGEVGARPGLQQLKLAVSPTAPRPLRPAPDFLAELPKLRALLLYRVEAPRALPELPAALQWLELNDANLPAAERELRAAAEPALRHHATRWLARLRALRRLTLVDQEAQGRLTPPPLAELPRLEDASVRVPLGRLPERWLSGSNLRRLALVSCDLSDLSMFPFDGTNLTVLNVSKNNLTVLPKGAFGQQEALWLLDVSGNGLRSGDLERALLPPPLGARGAGRGALPALRDLRASGNPLGSLCGTSSNVRGRRNSKLPRNLTRLELRSTGATRLCTDWLSESNLTVIDLRDNRIEFLDYDELEMIRSTGVAQEGVRLMLDGNPLREVGVTRDQLAGCSAAARARADPDGTTRAPVLLSLSALHCTCNNAALRALLACPLLRLEGSPACTGHTRTFLQHEPDQLLCRYEIECPPGCSCGAQRLSDNATVVECLGAAPPAAWPGWAAASPARPLALRAPAAGLAGVPAAALVELLAPNNSIAELDEADIRATLKVLDLRNNNITRVSEAAAARLRGKNVSLAGNPFSCTCRHQAALARLKDARVSDWEELTCGGSGALRGRLLSELRLTADELCTSALPWLLGGALAAAALLAGAAAALWPRARPRLKQFLFERQLCLDWVLGADDEVDDPAKTHDAFVSYAHQDHACAMKVVRGLERRGYSTVEHCRDWLPGAAVAEHIARSVLCARRTLLLVSDDYGASKWALEEFRAAHAHALASRSARVLLLRCGLRAPQRLPPDLQLHLRLNTYLDLDDAGFWRKLCRAMPPPRAAPAPEPAEPLAKPPRLWTPPAPRAAPLAGKPACALTPPAPRAPAPAPAPAPAAAERLRRLLSPESPPPSPVLEQPAATPRPLAETVG